MRSHGVSRNDPTTLSELVGNSKLIEQVAIIGVKTECNQRKTLTTSFGHEQEAHLLDGGSQVVGGLCQVEHDGAVARLAETDQLVVLAQDLGSAAGEVQGQRSLVSTQVVDVEDQFCGKELGVTPDAPADTGVDETIFVARNVD